MAKATEAIFLRVRVEDARTLRKAAKARRMPLATFVRWAALRYTQLEEMRDYKLGSDHQIADTAHA